jgi:hypothetical protein
MGKVFKSQLVVKLETFVAGNLGSVIVARMEPTSALISLLAASTASADWT